MTEMENAMVDMEAQSHPSKADEPSPFLKANHPVTLKFEDVIYTIKEPKGRERHLIGLKKRRSTLPKSESEKIILKGLTGVVKPNEMLAILGPSGSGKTTLLAALGGRLSGGQLTGTITYNKVPFSGHVKRTMGFVSQDDIFHPHLTVTETLFYTALLRLPNTLSREEKISHCEAIIHLLGLDRCKNTVVGGPSLKGISGGERKRVSIAQEMLVNPSLLLLDEPTSGLDSTSAHRILSGLSELANGGRTLVVSIHQPSSRLFCMFQKVLLLCEGNPLYFGSGLEIVDYFESIGYSPPDAVNPAEFLLDLANGILLEDWKDQGDVKKELVHAYQTSLADKVKAQLRDSDDGSTDYKSQKWSISWWQQFTILFARGLRARKHDNYNSVDVIQFCLASAFSGLLWWQSDLSHLQDQIGLLYYHVAFWGFQSGLQSVFTFPLERSLLQKERSSGMYRLSSYFMAQTVNDLPMELGIPVVFVTISYWMAGLRSSASSFLHYLIAVLLCVLTSQSAGLAIGSFVTNQKHAVVLVTLFIQMSYLSGGFFTARITPFIAWVKYLSFFYHTYKLLLGSQYKVGETYPCSDQNNKVCLIEDFPSIKPIGLKGQFVSVVALLIMIFTFRLISYAFLRQIGVIRKPVVARKI